jgi:hypothetical protein
MQGLIAITTLLLYHSICHDQWLRGDVESMTWLLIILEGLAVLIRA